MSFVKDVSRREMEFSLMMAALGIAPAVIKVVRLPNMRYRLTIEKYPIDLDDYQEEGGKIEDVEEQVDAYIDMIHNLGLIHGDLHHKNVVLDPKTKDVKLIDFATMQYFDEIDLTAIADWMGMNDPFNSVEEVKQHEYEMYRIH